MKYFALFLSFFLLLGCQEAPKFDRVNAFNNDAPEYVPYSRYFKKQVIKTETDDKLVRTLIQEYDEIGRLIFMKITDTRMGDFDREFRYDYSKGKFSSYSKLPDVGDMEGDLTLDSNGHIVRLQAQDADSTLDIQNTFEEGKKIQSQSLWQSETENENSSQTINFLWKENLISQINQSLYREGKENISVSTNYQYDATGKLASSSKMVTIKSIDETYNAEEMLFTDYNEYGDWTKALGYEDTKLSFIITREIEYF